jgi:SSS family solute:Na+ symporter
MHWLDYVVLVGYFVALIGIGIWSARRIKIQEDYFMGGRSFGKLLQTFAAFGAGTGSSDPVNIGRTTYTSGLSGMWSVMSWLFVTPFYWITGVWYRRMRHLTLGDWFVERYESRLMGLAYAIFGLLFFMVYGSMMFSAIGKVAAPLVGFSSVQWNGTEYGIEYVLVPVIGVVVLVYGIAGGLRAAYFTDLIQGMCIILLSILLIPFGLAKLVERFGSDSDGLLAGFRIMHEQLPESFFTIAGSSATSEFPLHRIVAVVIISLIGIVVQPHFIATGGGSARTETNARVGLVLGNFLKRFCTVGWVITALIALALFADRQELVSDPDKTWGVASRELLGPGLTGLMLACLLAALMSSIDAYMIVGSALVVRNIYAPYINDRASEREYVLLARITGSMVVLGAVLISLYVMNVFEQLQLTWVFPVLFAAPFWIGMYWRRATTTAAWITVAFCTLAFFLIPFALPRLVPALREIPRFHTTSAWTQTITTRLAAPSDLRKLNPERQRRIAAWDEAKAAIDSTPDDRQRQAALDQLGERPTLLVVGQPFETTRIRGGQAAFWGNGIKPVDGNGNALEDLQPQAIGPPRRVDENTVEIPWGYPADVKTKGFGNFKLDFLLYQTAGVDLSSLNDATLGTLELPPKIILPFLVMVFFSLVTRRNSPQALDRYYVKMKTPVDPDHQADEAKLTAAYATPEELEKKKLLPGTDFEFQRPSVVDVAGFVICVAICFAIIGMAVLVANIGR